MRFERLPRHSLLRYDGDERRPLHDRRLIG